MELYGQKQVSWTRLGKDALIGEKFLVVDKLVSWKKNDEIVLTNGKTVSGTCQEDSAEIRVITGASQNRPAKGQTTIFLNKALIYNHKGTKTQLTTQKGKVVRADFRGAVGLLTHNVRIIGKTATGKDGKIVGLPYGTGITVAPAEFDKPNVHKVTLTFALAFTLALTLTLTLTFTLALTLALTQCPPGLARVVFGRQRL